MFKIQARWISSEERSRSADVAVRTEFATQGLEEGSPLGEIGIFHLQGHRNVSLHVDGGVGVDDDGLRGGGAAGAAAAAVAVAAAPSACSHGARVQVQEGAAHRERWRGKGGGSGRPGSN